MCTPLAVMGKQMSSPPWKSRGTWRGRSSLKCDAPQVLFSPNHLSLGCSEQLWGTQEGQGSWGWEEEGEAEKGFTERREVQQMWTHLWV